MTALITNKTNLIQISDATDHSTIPETTRHTDGPTTNVEQETTGTTVDSGSTTSSGTTTSIGSTPSRTTPSVTSAGTPAWTTQQHIETTQTEHETTHYHSPPSTPEIDSDGDENEFGNKYEDNNGQENTPVQYTDPPQPEPEPEPPFYPHVPPPSYNPGVRPKSKNNGRITSEAEERTAMIIGIVAGACIAVVLVILLLVWLKSNGDRTYKAEHGIGYGQGPNAALLGTHSNTGTNGSRHHQTNGANAPFNNNGSMRNGSEKGPVPGLVPQKPKKRDSKDIKEWYV